MKKIDQLTTSVNGVLGPLGFKKRRLTWHRVTDEVIQVVNLQRSKWGEQYYINMGIHFRGIARSGVPKVSQCHMIARLSMLIDRSEPSSFVIDLEKVEYGPVISYVTKSLDSIKDSFLEKCRSLKGVRSFLRKQHMVMVTDEGKALLRALQ